MLRVVLIHDGVRIPLPSGQTLIGRGLHCRLRFHDPSVSREHLRVVVSDERAIVENLSRTKGSTINNRPLVGARPLRDGDIVSIGFRRFVVLLEPHVATGSERVGLAEDDSILVDQEALADDETRPDAPPVIFAEITSATSHGSVGLAGGDVHDDSRRPVEALETGGRACASAADRADHSFHASRRAYERFAIELPVVYRSAALTIDCETRNISMGGVFIASELLDPIGTRCELSLRPEGNSAVGLDGVVVRVQAGGAPAQVPGMGVQFMTRPPDVARWLRRASGAVR